MLLAHSGNRIDDDRRSAPRFPPEQVGQVTAVVARALADLRPSAVVSAPANGADLIVLSQAQQLGIATHVLLPLPVDDFAEQSVDGADPAWRDCYRAVLDRAHTTVGSSMELLDLGADPQWYLTAQGLILERARSAARPDEAIIALTVRPTDGETPPSATDEFAHKASEAGLTVLTIDPRPGQTGALRVA